MDIRYDAEITEQIERVRRYNADTVRRAYIYTFGCQQNEADSEHLLGLAHAMGYATADTPEEADLILVNTCAIREHAELRALSAVGSCKKLRERRPDLILGVCGCMTAQEHRIGELRMRYPYVDFTLDPASLHRLPAAVAAVLQNREAGRDRRRLFLTGGEQPELAEGVPQLRAARHRAWVSIMYGCNNFCSYCVVPYVRGRERSRRPEDIEAEVRALIDDGCRDITLLGQNVNSYRGGCDFAALLARLASLPGDFTLRFMTSHPKDVSPALIDVFGRYPKIAPHFHLPLQSGSDRILQAMNRRYDTAHYLQTVEDLRAARPDTALTSDIIVGFPGETDEDFEATLSMLRQVRFDMVYSFLYSPRKGTPAAAMEQQIDPAAKGARMQRLLALQDEIALEYNRAAVGQTLRVLIDGQDKDGGLYSGRTGQNKLVHVAATDRDIGEFRMVKIERAEPYAMVGTLQK